VGAQLAASAGYRAGSAVYLRPLQPQQQTAIAPVMPPPAPVQPIRTVTWFEAHQDEMRAKVALCDDNPGLGQHDTECPNALAAKLDVGFDNFINSK